MPDGRRRPLARSACVVAAALVVGVVALITPARSMGADARIPTSTTLTAPTSPVELFAPLTFTATIEPAPGGGWVNWWIDGSNRANGQVGPDGTTSLEWPAGFYYGDHTVYVQYLGNDTHAWSTSETATLTVVDDRTPVTVTMSTDPNPSLRRDPVDMHAVVTPNPGGGTVRFLENGHSQMQEVPIGADGTADFTGSFGVTASYSLTACFSGNEAFRDACSDEINQEVTSISTTTTMSITPSTVYPDESFTIKVAVTPVPEVETSVRVGRSPFHTYVWIPLDPTTGKGEMTLVSDQLYAFFPLGTYDLTGSFEGTPHHDASSSSPVPFTVRVDEPTIVATTTDGPVHVGEPVTFSLSVTPVPTADGAQAGFLLFPPPASYSRGPVLIDLGVDGSGETTVDTDGWYAGEYGYRAICCSDPHIEQTEIQGSFTLIDEDPPTGTAEFFGDDVVMSNRLSVHVPAADGIGSGVNWVALSNDAVTWTEMPYFETVPWTLEPGDGVRTVFVKWRDQAGNWSEVASASVTVDTGTGLVTTPQAGVLSSNLETGLVPTKLGWSGGTGAGPVSFRVEKSKDGGAYALVKDGVGSTSLTSSLSPGHSYRFRVRAVGQASDAGQWSYGTTFKLTAVSQASSAVRYRGAWTGSSGSKWWGGSVKSSSSKGSTASYTFTGKKIAWVSLKAANRGKAQVYVNGVLKATVDLYSKTTQQQRIVWSANYTTSAKRTITIKVLGTSGRPRVDVDGFIVGS